MLDEKLKCPRIWIFPLFDSIYSCNISFYPSQIPEYCIVWFILFTHSRFDPLALSVLTSSCSKSIAKRVPGAHWSPLSASFESMGASPIPSILPTS